jgi:hypothetical protein
MCRRDERTLNNRPKSKGQKTDRRQDVKRTDARGTAIENDILLKNPDTEYNLIRHHLEFVFWINTRID